jgi:hypothetical protein
MFLFLPVFICLKKKHKIQSNIFSVNLVNFNYYIFLLFLLRNNHKELKKYKNILKNFKNKNRIGLKLDQ